MAILCGCAREMVSSCHTRCCPIAPIHVRLEKPTEIGTAYSICRPAPYSANSQVFLPRKLTNFSNALIPPGRATQILLSNHCVRAVLEFASDASRKVAVNIGCLRFYSLPVALFIKAL